MEVGADEEMVVAGLQGGVGHKLELEGVLRSLADNVVIAQASQLHGGMASKGRSNRKRAFSAIEHIITAIG